MVQLSLTSLFWLYVVITLSVFFVMIFLLAGCFGNTALFFIRLKKKEEQYSKENTIIFWIKGLTLIFLSFFILYLGISRNLPYPIFIFFIPLLFCIFGVIAGLKIDPKIINFKTPRDVWFRGAIGPTTYFPTETNASIKSLAGLTIWLSKFDLKYVFASLLIGIILTAFILLTNQ